VAVTGESLWIRIGGKVRRLADRVTHSTHRQAACLRMSTAGRPARVVFVCYGNICRSPYAEARLKQSLVTLPQFTILVESAGLYGPGRPANRQGAERARLRGLDLSRHRSRLVDEIAPCRGAGDLVLVMTHQQHTAICGHPGTRSARVELLGDSDPTDPPSREIEAPSGQSDEVFARVSSQIDRSIDGLCRLWGAQG
jgi:protein-tyrosine phosphatase